MYSLAIGTELAETGHLFEQQIAGNVTEDNTKGTMDNKQNIPHVLESSVFLKYIHPFTKVTDITTTTTGLCSERKFTTSVHSS